MSEIDIAKSALDSIIGKARSAFYKPIQIAETLYRDRVFSDISLSEKETYRIRRKEWRARIQSIVTESDLINWYEKALRGSYSDILGDRLLEKMAIEIKKEFPSLDKKPDIITERRYDLLSDSYWSIIS